MTESVQNRIGTIEANLRESRKFARDTRWLLDYCKAQGKVVEAARTVVAETIGREVEAAVLKPLGFLEIALDNLDDFSCGD